ncbi:hypothetical protein BG015_003088 [Linnemannia schmuckeri]|uniref:F-box domain-containing protein n=1 Tax=Linnemannia schmuckeri TaxID=64567 RepID=A0A9P5V5T1_9FUNG|nr:hypothetical protein BG015_003088 [Linnemannia schmuckeri]
MTRQGDISRSHLPPTSTPGAQQVDSQGRTTAAVFSIATTTNPILESREMVETTTAALDALAIISIPHTSATSKAFNKPSQHIPTEVVIAFGKLLGGPSLYACLQVCHQWFHALRSLAWVTITRRQRYLGSFPLKPWTKLALPFDTNEEKRRANKIFASLVHTRSAEWYDVPAVRHRGWKGPGYLPSYRSEMGFTKLSFVFRSMPQLSRLSLIITSETLYHNSVLDVLKVSNLPHLHYLRLHLSFSYSPLAVEELFPLFSRLAERNVRGNWYHDLDTHGRRFSTYAPWKLKRFTIDHVQTRYFLRHCPSTLEEMTFRRPMAKWSQRGAGYRERMLQQLLDMPRLKMITVSGIQGSDPVEYRTENPISLEALWKKTTVTATEAGGRITTVGDQEVAIRDIAEHLLSSV